MRVISHIDKLCRTRVTQFYVWHDSILCVTSMCVKSHIDKLCRTCKWVMSHVWMSYVTHMTSLTSTRLLQLSHATHVNESCHTYKWIMSHIYGTQTHARTHTQTHTRKHIHIHKYKHTSSYKHTYSYTHIDTRIHTHVRAHVRARTRTCACAHSHTHTHTNKHNVMCWLLSGVDKIYVWHATFLRVTWLRVWVSVFVWGSVFVCVYVNVFACVCLCVCARMRVCNSPAARCVSHKGKTFVVYHKGLSFVGNATRCWNFSNVSSLLHERERGREKERKTGRKGERTVHARMGVLENTVERDWLTPQKSPAYPQKSPTYPQKSPT